MTGPAANDPVDDVVDLYKLIGCMSPIIGWITVGEGSEAVEIDIIDLFGDGCRVRCRPRLTEGAVVGLRLGGTLFARALVSWWRDGWADLRFVETPHEAKADPPRTGATRGTGCSRL